MFFILESRCLFCRKGTKKYLKSRNTSEKTVFIRKLRRIPTVNAMFTHCLREVYFGDL